MSSSSDDFSIFARFTSKTPIKSDTGAKEVRDDEDPDWLATHEPETAQKGSGGVITIDSESDDARVTARGGGKEDPPGPSSPLSKFKRSGTTTKQASKHSIAEAPASSGQSRKRLSRAAARKPIVELPDVSDGSDSQPDSNCEAGAAARRKPTAPAAAKQGGAAPKAPTAATKRKTPQRAGEASKPADSSDDGFFDSDDEIVPKVKQKAVVRSKKPLAAKRKTPDRASKVGEEKPVATLQASAAGAKPAGTPKADSKGKPGDAPPTPIPPGLEAAKGEVPVIIPEKINRSKLLVELESKQGPEGLSSADLSGDAGAVGRLIVGSAQDGKQELHVDLKGVMYSATLVPAPGTLCVVSVGPTEAKVEAMVTAFAQLREESTLGMAETVMEGDLNFLDLDEDDYTPAIQEKAGNGSLAGTAPGKATGQKKGGASNPRAKATKAKPKSSKAKPKTAKPKAGKAAGAQGGLGVSKKSAGVRKKN
mmetsp:Transcript_33309/g.94381  ORF Transcript_33309/g.94381 Transcript_33309/m.94381 type:complete len:479 (+) Transcript_33309:331-1767(+)